ncbi:MAG TPA: hypothetical protein PLI16_09990 [Bacteroidales bacterium]|nr:hypothetical protein [Bacteroidales bacterium]HNZ42641.1 hypothetical protein [Bacteroidales bacterium]HOH84929.1 hypothetical protein [Bacteroidales bacterium]HPB24569.1 hypothetical protein [Bacteroidales bacterium]HPI29404.1 hypothetical protein [Bacteroidales bacterium]
MDKDQVPQDKNHYLDKNFKTVVYALDPDGKYTKVPSLGWEPEHFAQKQAWDSVAEDIEIIKKNVIAGNVSPIAYFIEKYHFSLRRLSHLTGFSKRQIKKHFRPEVFSALHSTDLGMYARAFQVPVDQIVKPF